MTSSTAEKTGTYELRVEGCEGCHEVEDYAELGVVDF